MTPPIDVLYIIIYTVSTVPWYSYCCHAELFPAFANIFGYRMLPEFLPIDQGIPLAPATRPGWKGVPKHRIPWARLQVGDSVMVPGKTAADARWMVRSPMNKHGHRYRARTVEGGIRIWRVE